MDWVLRMAWRDSRGRRGRLLLHTASIAVGIAALTGLRGFSRTMERNVDEQAATLMGADVEIESPTPFEGELGGIVDSLAALGGRKAEEAEMNSMVLFPASGGSRLARVRALQGGFPFYGELGTDPPEAAAAWQSGGMALVDDGMMLQYGVAVGDTIRVGRESLAIAGRLLNLPGETAFRSDLQPVVFMPLSRIGQTGLIQRGSRVRYRAHFQLPVGTDAAALSASLDERLERFDAGIETVEDHKRRLGRTLRNLYRFLGLGSFVALLLGAVGVASAIHAHVEQKLETIAVLRSLGAASGAALRIYLVQAFAMGLIGSLAGAAAGTALLWRLPALLADFLPKELGELQAAPSLPALGEGVAAGSAISLVFAALPLLAVRRVSPLLALRASYEAEPGRSDRLARALLLGLAAGATFLLAWALAGRPDHALYFAGGTLAALLLLAATARLLRGALRRFLPSSCGYLLRQGLANLYRPHNQTLLLLASLGLGTFLVAALYTAQTSILGHVNSVAGGQRPNMVLFDIQSDQKEAAAALVREMGMPVMQEVPVVATRLREVKGKTVEELLRDGPRRGRWALRREYRVTYRDSTTATEEIVAGQWRGSAADTAFISLERRLAEALDVAIGDRLLFDVQGVPVEVVVGSLRQVEWQRIMPNFLVLFPAGVLEEAPQFHVLVTRSGDAETRAGLQRRAVGDFPNVSVIDLDLVLITVDKVLAKVAVVVRFVALFSIATGLAVLAAVVTGSRFQRLRESALLRTLGASRGQVGKILLIEYLLLGGLAGLVGLLLAMAGGWALAAFVFEVTFAPSWQALGFALIAVPLCTVLAGLLGSRGVHRAPPLEVLRQAD